MVSKQLQYAKLLK